MHVARPSKLSAALVRVAATGSLLIGMAGGAVVGAVGASAASCAPPGTPPGVSALKNIDTSLGCDNPGGTATNPATGWITVNFPMSNQLWLMDTFAPGPGATSYPGNYQATFTNCIGGTATPGGWSAPGGGTLSLWTAPTLGGTVSCQYSVAYAGTAIGPTSSLANLAQFYTTPTASVLYATAYSAIVHAFGAPLVPEVRFAALLPLAGIVTFGVLIGFNRRRGRHVVVR